MCKKKKKRWRCWKKGKNRAVIIAARKQQTPII